MTLGYGHPIVRLSCPIEWAWICACAIAKGWTARGGPLSTAFPAPNEVDEKATGLRLGRDFMPGIPREADMTNTTLILGSLGTIS